MLEWQEILCYLDRIRTIFHELLDGNLAALQKVDERTVKAVELTAPGASTSDAETLRSQIHGGQIFGAFNDQEREHILTKLLLVDGIIPSLHTFFRDLGYLQACVNCVKRLTSLSPGQTLFNAMEYIFTGINQRDGQVTLQIAESEFVSRPGTAADQINLGYQQIHAYAMRNFLDMPQELHDENLLAIPKKEADKGRLRRFAELAQRLGFESPEITMLKENPHSTTEGATNIPSKPVLVTSGNGVIKKRRCGLPATGTYKEDSRFLYLNDIYTTCDERSEGITSFFVRRSVFFAFYGRHPWTNMNSATCESGLPQQMGHNQAQGVSDHGEQDMNEILTSLDGTHSLAMTPYVLEQDASHQERLEQERRTQARLSQERREQQWREQERLEREWQEQQERERQQQAERERREQAEREAQEQAEREAQEQAERERREQAEREAQEQAERERREAQEQAERERQEEQERSNQARIREGGNRGTQLDLDKLLTHSQDNTLLISSDNGKGLREKENQEPEDASNQDVAPTRQMEEDITGSTTLPQSTRNSTKVRIVFKTWESDHWRDKSDHLVDPSDTSEIKRVAKENMRKKIRLFDSNLRMLTPRDCFEAATTDGTNSIYLIPEANLNAINEIAATAPEIRDNFMARQELGRKREAVDEISERYHVKKKQIL